MPISVDHICNLLSNSGIRYKVHGRKRILIGYRSDVYRNPKGEDTVLMVIRVSEAGRYFKLYAPEAYRIPKEKAGIFALACTFIQWKTKLIQFEVDPKDGEVRPMIEFPIEDAELTGKQLMRCLSGMVQILDRFHPTFVKVIEEGLIDFGEDEDAAGALSHLLSQVPPDVLAEALRLADDRRRSSNGRG